MTDQDATHQQWIPVIGRSLAFLCVQLGDAKEKTLADKAVLLEALGLERKDAAAMLGTTSASITETLSRAKRTKKGARRDAKTTKKSRGRK